MNTLGGSIKTMRPRNARGTAQYVNDIHDDVTVVIQQTIQARHCLKIFLFKPWSALEKNQQQCASLRSKHVKSATRMSVTDRVMQVASMTCHASGVSDNCNPNCKSGLPKLKVPHHLFATQQALRPLAMQALATLKCA